MRLFNFALLLGAVGLATAQEDYDEDEVRENTYFNGQLCPPLRILTPLTWDDAMKETKYMMVKHYRFVLPISLPWRRLWMLTVSQPILRALPGVRPDIPNDL